MNDAPLLIVTGLSGAGKSTALKALEDLGWEAVDNLPVSLLPALLDAPTPGPLALGLDARTRAFDAGAIAARVAAERASGRSVGVLFLDCAGDALVRRFSETRRRHPLAGDRPASDGIAREREMLSELRRTADVVIDTTNEGPNDLRRALATRFPTATPSAPTLTLMSFGYARGVPRDADLVFDMRFLHNPHWLPELRPLTGRDPAVAAHVAADPAFDPAVSRIIELLDLLIPGYGREGRAYVTVAFGCTGGRHRSIAVTEYVATALAARGHPAVVMHRDTEVGPGVTEDAAPATGLTGPPPARKSAPFP
jgi:UPF0042 nucleotide-binding protein